MIKDTLIRMLFSQVFFQTEVRATLKLQSLFLRQVKVACKQINIKICVICESPSERMFIRADAAKGACAPIVAYLESFWITKPYC